MTEHLFPSPPLNDLIRANSSPYILQNLPSTLVALVLDVIPTLLNNNNNNNRKESAAEKKKQPKEGDVIFDMCAAPGGKTTHIAALLNGKGRVYAGDKSKRKIANLVELCHRLQLDSIVEGIYIDSATALLPPLNEEIDCLCPNGKKEDTISEKIGSRPAEWKKLRGKNKKKGFPRETFDRILLDPPCSGIGMGFSFDFFSRATNRTVELGT